MKKLMSVLLTVIMMFSFVTPAFAQNMGVVSADTCADDLEMYTQYKIDLNHQNISQNRETTEDPSSKARAMTTGKNLSDAVCFVESLKLDENGYGYIREACIKELEEYQEKGIELTSYTVLVPKSNRSETIYGTYNGRTFYYALTSISDFNIEKNGDSPAQETLDDWIRGALDLVIGFALQEFSLPYSMVMSALNISGNVSLSYGTHNRYLFQMFDVKTRTIYTYSGDTKRTVLTDQIGKAHISIYLVPVGGDVVGEQLTASYANRELKTKFYDNVSRNLQKAYVMYNHKGVDTWSLITEVLTESWG